MTAAPVTSERQIRNSFIYFVPTILSLALPLVTLPIFTRILTPEDYGALALANAYAAFASGLANFGLVMAYERNFFEYPEGKQRAALLYSTIAFVMTAQVVAAGVTWWFRHGLSVALTRSPAYGSLVFWAFCATGLASIKAYYLMYFRNTHDASTYVRYTVDENVLGVVLSLFAVAYLRVGVIGLVVSQSVASAVVLTVLMARFLSRLPFAFSWTLLADSLKISFPMTARLLVGVVSNQFDKYLLGRLGSIGGAGLYSIGQRFAGLAFGVMTALENVFAPRVYELMFARAADEEDRVGRYLTPFIYAAIGAALLMCLFAEEAINMLTPNAYHGAVAIVSILAMYNAVMFFGKQPQLVFARKTHLISLLAVITMALNVAFVALGLKLGGVIGVAWGMFAAGTATIILKQQLMDRYYPIRWQRGRLVSILGLFFASAILVIVMSALDIPYSVRLGTKLILAAAYVWLGFHLDIVNAGSLGVLRSAISGFWRRPAASTGLK